MSINSLSFLLSFSSYFYVTQKILNKPDQNEMKWKILTRIFQFFHFISIFFWQTNFSFFFSLSPRRWRKTMTMIIIVSSRLFFLFGKDDNQSILIVIIIIIIDGTWIFFLFFLFWSMKNLYFSLFDFQIIIHVDILPCDIRKSS